MAVLAKENERGLTGFREEFDVRFCILYMKFALTAFKIRGRITMEEGFLNIEFDYKKA